MYVKFGDPIASVLRYRADKPINRQTEVKTIPSQLPLCKKVKASHTRYRTLGPELIPVYRQSARR